MINKPVPSKSKVKNSSPLPKDKEKNKKPPIVKKQSEKVQIPSFQQEKIPQIRILPCSKVEEKQIKQTKPISTISGSHKAALLIHQVILRKYQKAFDKIVNTAWRQKQQSHLTKHKITKFVDSVRKIQLKIIRVLWKGFVKSKMISPQRKQACNKMFKILKINSNQLLRYSMVLIKHELIKQSLKVMRQWKKWDVQIPNQQQFNSLKVSLSTDTIIVMKKLINYQYETFLLISTTELKQCFQQQWRKFTQVKNRSIKENQFLDFQLMILLILNNIKAIQETQAKRETNDEFRIVQNGSTTSINQKMDDGRKSSSSQIVVKQERTTVAKRLQFLEKQVYYGDQNLKKFAEARKIDYARLLETIQQQMKRIQQYRYQKIVASRIMLLRILMRLSKQHHDLNHALEDKVKQLAQICYEPQYLQTYKQSFALMNFPEKQYLIDITNAILYLHEKNVESENKTQTETFMKLEILRAFCRRLESSTKIFLNSWENQDQQMTPINLSSCKAIFPEELKQIEINFYTMSEYLLAEREKVQKKEQILQRLKDFLQVFSKVLTGNKQFDREWKMTITNSQRASEAQNDIFKALSGCNQIIMSQIKESEQRIKYVESLYQQQRKIALHQAEKCKQQVLVIEKLKEQIEKLEEKNQAFQQEVQRVHLQKYQADQKLQQAYKNMEKARQQLDQWQNKEEEYVRKINLLDQNVNSLKGNLEGTQNQLVSNLKKSTRLQDSKRSQNQELNYKIQTLEQFNNFLNERVMQTDSKLIEQRQKNALMHEQLKISKNQIDENNQSIKNLQYELNYYKGKVATIQSQNEGLYSKNRTLSQKLAKLESQIQYIKSRQEQQVKNYSDLNQSLSVKLSEAQKKIQAFGQKEDSFEYKMQILQSQNSHLMKQLQEKVEKIFGLKIKQNDFKDQLDKLVAIKDRLQNEISTQNRQLSQIQGQREQTQQQLNKIKQQCDELRGQLLELQLNQIYFKHEALQYIQDLTEARERISMQLNEQQTIFSVQRQNYDAMLQERQLNIQKKKFSLVQKQNLLAEKEIKLKQLQLKRNQLELNLNSIRLQYQQLQERQKIQASQIHNLKQQLKSLTQSANQETKSKVYLLQQSDKKVNQLTKALKDLQTIMNNIEQENEDLRLQIQKKSQQVKIITEIRIKMEQQILNFKESTAQHKNIMKEYSEHYHRLQKQLTEQRIDTDKLKQENRVLKTQNQSLQNKINQLQQTQQQLHGQICELQARLSSVKQKEQRIEQLQDILSAKNVLCEDLNSRLNTYMDDYKKDIEHLKQEDQIKLENALSCRQQEYQKVFETIKQEYEQEILRLKLLIDSTTKDTEKFDILKQKIDLLQLQVDQLRRQAGNHIKEKELLLRNQQKLQQEIEVLRQTTKLMQQKQQQKENLIDALKRQREIIQVREKVAVTELSMNLQRSRTLEQQNIQLKQRMLDQEKSQQSFNQTILVLQNLNSSVVEQIKMIENDKHKLQDELLTMTISNRHLQAQKMQNDKQYQELLDKVMKMQEQNIRIYELDQKNTRIDTLKREVQELLDIQKSLRNKLQQESAISQLFKQKLDEQAAFNLRKIESLQEILNFKNQQIEQMTRNLEQYAQQNTKLKDLQKMQKAHQRELQKMEKQLHMQQRQKNALDEAFKLLQMQFKQKLSFIEELQQKKQIIQMQLNNALTENENLEKSINNYKQVVKNLDQACKQQEREVQKLKQQLQFLVKQNCHLNEIIQSQKKMIQIHQQKNSQSTYKIQTLKNVMSIMATQNVLQIEQDHRPNVEQTHGQKLQEGEFRTFQIQIDRDIKNIQQVDESFAENLKQIRKQLERKQNNSKSQIVKLKSEICQLKSEIVLQQEKMISLEKQGQKKMGQLQQMKENSDRIISKLKQQLTDSYQQIDKLQQQNKLLRQQICSKDQAHNQLNSEKVSLYDKLIQQIQDSKQKISQKQEENSTLRKQMLCLEKILQKADGRTIQKLQQEITSLKSIIGLKQQLNCTYVNKIKELECLNSQSFKLGQQIRSLRLQNNQLAANYNCISQENEKSKLQLQMLIVQNCTTKEAVRQLQERIRIKDSEILDNQKQLQKLFSIEKQLIEAKMIEQKLLQAEAQNESIKSEYSAAFAMMLSLEKQIQETRLKEQSENRQRNSLLLKINLLQSSNLIVSNNKQVLQQLNRQNQERILIMEKQIAVHLQRNQESKRFIQKLEGQVTTKTKQLEQVRLHQARQSLTHEKQLKQFCNLIETNKVQYEHQISILKTHLEEKVIQIRQSYEAQLLNIQNQHSNQLKHKEQTLSQQLTQLKTSNDFLSGQCSNLQRQLKAIQQQHQKLEQSEKQKSQLLGVLIDQNKQLSAKISDLELANQQIKKQFDLLQNDVKDKLEATIKENGQLKNNLKLQQQQSEKVKQQLSQQIEFNKTQIDTLALFEQQKYELQSRNLSLQQQVKKMASKVQKNQQSLIGMQLSVNQKQRRIRKLIEENEIMKKELISVEEKCNALEQKVQQAGRQSEAVEQLLHKKEYQKQQIQKQVSLNLQQNQKLLTLNRQFSEREQQKQNQLIKVSQNYNQLLREFSQFKQQTQNEFQNDQKVQQQIERLQLIIKELQDALKQARQQVQILSMENKYLNQEVDQTSSKLHKETKGNQLLNETIAKYDLKLKALNKLIKEKDKSIKSFESQIKIIEQKFIMLERKHKQQCQDAENELISAKRQANILKEELLNERSNGEFISRLSQDNIKRMNQHVQNMQRTYHMQVKELTLNLQFAEKEKNHTKKCLAEVEREYQVSQLQVKKLRIHNRNLQSQLEVTTSPLAISNIQKVSQIKAEYIALQNRFRSSDSKIQDLQQEISRLSAKNRSLTKEMESLRHKQRNFSISIEERDINNEQFNIRYNQMKLLYEKQQRKNAVHQERQIELQKTKNTAKSIINDQKQKIIELEKQLSRLQGGFKKKQTYTFRSNQFDGQTSHGQINQAIYNLQKRIKMQQIRQKQLQQEIDSLRRFSHTFTQDISKEQESQVESKVQHQQSMITLKKQSAVSSLERTVSSQVKRIQQLQRINKKLFESNKILQMKSLSLGQQVKRQMDRFATVKKETDSQVMQLLRPSQQVEQIIKSMRSEAGNSRFRFLYGSERVTPRTSRCKTQNLGNQQNDSQHDFQHGMSMRLHNILSEISFPEHGSQLQEKRNNPEYVSLLQERINRLETILQTIQQQSQEACLPIVTEVKAEFKKSLKNSVSLKSEVQKEVDLTESQNLSKKSLRLANLQQNSQSCTLKAPKSLQMKRMHQKSDRVQRFFNFDARDPTKNHYVTSEKRLPE